LGFTDPWSFSKSFSNNVAYVLLCLLFCVSTSNAIAAQEAGPPEKPDAAVRTQMRNVNYHLSDKVSVRINYLNGSLVPIGNNAFPVTDDRNSFTIRIDTAQIAISPQDLANLLNSFVFARPGSPVSGISVATTPNGQLKVKGRLHDKGDIPFETQGVLNPTKDGRLRLHSDKVRALHVPVKGLMDALGIDVADLIKSGKVPGLQAEENDLIVDLEQILPPPHIDGKVSAIRVETNSIIQTFGGADAKSGPKTQSGNYMAFQGNRLRVGKLTMDDTDIVLSEMNPAAPLDFFLDHYKDQLAAGYTKISPAFQVHAFIRNFDKLGPTKPPAKSKEKEEH
jgi:hypothetical protein